jgi:hypothetical protein
MQLATSKMLLNRETGLRPMANAMSMDTKLERPINSEGWVMRAVISA